MLFMICGYCKNALVTRFYWVLTGFVSGNLVEHWVGTWQGEGDVYLECVEGECEMKGGYFSRLRLLMRFDAVECKIELLYLLLVGAIHKKMKKHPLGVKSPQKCQKAGLYHRSQYSLFAVRFIVL